MSSPLPRLNGPVIVPNHKDGTKSIAWSIPKEYASKLVNLLWEEAKVAARLAEIDKAETLLSATYIISKSDFVLFACLLFVEHYNNCRIVSQSYTRDKPLYAVEETCDERPHW